MTNTLTLTPSTSYPLFTANQVLSDVDLNRMVTYLESQNRLSRNHFMGMGIACGLIPSATFVSTSNPPTATITIAPGSGITSEGYVVSLSQRVTLTHYQKSQTIAASRFQVNQEAQLNSQATAVAADSTVTVAKAPLLYTVTELFEGDGGNPNHQPLHMMVKPQTQETFRALLKKHILIVLYEQEDTSRDTCLLDCDDLGRDRNFTLRYFLLPKTTPEDAPTDLSADALLDSGYAPSNLPAPWTNYSVPEIFQLRQSFLLRHRIQVPRLGNTAAANSAFGFETYTAFLEHYRTLCEQTIKQISPGLTHVVEIFSPFFSSFQPQPEDFTGVGNRLSAHLQTITANFPTSNTANLAQPEAPYTIQYFYDYLVQIVAAYNELVQTAFDLMDDCLPDIRRFPKFLMLGQIPSVSDSDAPSDAAVPLSNLNDPYRSHFVQPPLYNQNHQRRRQVRHLYNRLVCLCAENAFAPLPFYAAPVHITPSRDRTTPLSEQAIPYYLCYAKLYNVWNYDAERKGLSAAQPAYFLPKSEAANTDNDLHYRLDAYNFYRIEGHLGKDKTTMLQQLRRDQQRWNLAFDIITLKISDRTDPDDGDILANLDQSGRLETLQQDFEGMQQIFQTLWTRYAEDDQNPEQDWSQNTCLATLKYIFFDQPKFSDIALNQLYNPVLAAVRADTTGAVYDFEPVSDATGRYRLFIRRTANDPPLARIEFQRVPDAADTPDVPREDSLNFSGLSEQALEDEQKRIRDLITAALVASQFTYGVETPETDDPSSSPEPPEPPEEFFVTLSLRETLQVPLDPPFGNEFRSAQVIIISQNTLSVSTTDSGPLVQEPPFQNYETLYGLLRDVPIEYANLKKLTFQIGNPLVALDYIRALQLLERIEAYQLHAEAVIGPQLLNNFSQLHPGIEHLGGVPKGGTFILAYADDPSLATTLLQISSSPAYTARVDGIQEAAVLPPGYSDELGQVRENFSNWTNIVVADYCLPYRLNSKHFQVTPSRAHLNLPPIVLLEKTQFCADDETRYEFLLYPPNGQLKGEGSFFANGKYSFQPTRVSPDLPHDVAISFSYAVEGCESSLVILISPKPDARFWIGKTDRTTFCATDLDIALIPCFGRGTFTAWDGENEISATVIQDNRLFQPSRVELEEMEEQTIITLRHRITNDQETCTGTTNRTVTIHAQPPVNFSFGTNDGSNDDNPFRSCVSVAELELIGTPANGVFRVLDDDQDISGRMLRGDRILPSAFNLEGASEKTLQVEYSVTDADGCTSTLSKPLILLALPNAAFQIGEANQTVISNDSDSLQLIPETSEGEFKASIAGIEVSAEVLDQQPTETLFIPQNVIIDQQQGQVQVLLAYSVRDANGCSQESVQEITVVAPPLAAFAVGDPSQTEFFVDDAPVPLIPQLLGGAFTAFDDNNQDVNAIEIQSQRSLFNPGEVGLGAASEKTIRLHHEITRQGVTETSDQTVTVRQRPDDANNLGAPSPSTADSSSPSPGNAPLTSRFSAADIAPPTQEAVNRGDRTTGQTPSTERSIFTSLRQRLMRSLPSQTSRLLALNPPAPLDRSRASINIDRVQPKLFWTGVIGVITTVMLLAWAGAEANRSRPSSAVNSSNRIDRSSQ